MAVDDPASLEDPNPPDPDLDELTPREEGLLMLRRIGWHPSNDQQLAVYAAMPPARKVAQLFAVRHAFMERLRARLRAEHPDASAAEIAALVLAELAWVREEYPPQPAPGQSRPSAGAD